MKRTCEDQRAAPLHGVPQPVGTEDVQGLYSVCPQAAHHQEAAALYGKLRVQN
jgi:hypothetical protein